MKKLCTLLLPAFSLRCCARLHNPRRAMLNLFNNASYVVNQKQQTAGTGYKPQVSATTASEKICVIINVKDNGKGIADTIMDKIMQPFFATKPTGEGTGLSLSLSCAIVMKRRGGMIGVITQRWDFTELIVSLPLLP